MSDIGNTIHITILWSMNKYQNNVELTPFLFQT